MSNTEARSSKTKPCLKKGQTLSGQGGTSGKTACPPKGQSLLETKTSQSWRSRWQVFASIGLATLLLGLAFWRLPDAEFTLHASIAEQSSEDAVSIEIEVPTANSTEQSLEIISNENILRALVAAEVLPATADLSTSSESVHRYANKLSAFTRTGRDLNERVIELTYKSQNSETGLRIMNCLVNQYVAQHSSSATPDTSDDETETTTVTVADNFEATAVQVVEPPYIVSQSGGRVSRPRFLILSAMALLAGGWCAACYQRPGPAGVLRTKHEAQMVTTVPVVATVGDIGGSYEKTEQRSSDSNSWMMRWAIRIADMSLVAIATVVVISLFFVEGFGGRFVDDPLTTFAKTMQSLMGS